MRIVVFGLAVSSTWGNGHAALWRGLIAALADRDCHVTFFEHDVPYYAEHRDVDALPGAELVLYPNWEAVAPRARAALAAADAGLVTSYCPDALAATALLLGSAVPVRAFYDLDTPVTLDRLERGETVDWLGPEGLSGFDLVLSYAGGGALRALRERLGARRAVPLYGWVDPRQHRPGAARPEFAAALSYLGTYAADRQATLEALFLEPARRLPERRFVIAGALYPDTFPWARNIFFVRHLPPALHPAFYAASGLTLNVTRDAMARLGWCPSGRLFEAAACGVPILTDAWEGMDAFLSPGSEILVARSTEEAMDALARPVAELAAMAARARERVLDEHTAAQRAATLLAALEPAPVPAEA